MQISGQNAYALMDTCASDDYSPMLSYFVHHQSITDITSTSSLVSTVVIHGSGGLISNGHSGSG